LGTVDFFERTALYVLFRERDLTTIHQLIDRPTVDFFKPMKTLFDTGLTQTDKEPAATTDKEPA
jgi:hypothetical protein